MADNWAYYQKKKRKQKRWAAEIGEQIRLFFSEKTEAAT